MAKRQGKTGKTKSKAKGGSTITSRQSASRALAKAKERKRLTGFEFTRPEREMELHDQKSGASKGVRAASKIQRTRSASKKRKR